MIEEMKYNDSESCITMRLFQMLLETLKRNETFISFVDHKKCSASLEFANNCFPYYGFILIIYIGITYEELKL